MKQVLKTLTYLFFATLLVTSCQNDDSELLIPEVSSTEENSNLTVEVLNASQINSNATILEELENVMPFIGVNNESNLSSSNNTASILDLDFNQRSYTINTDRVIYTAKGDYHSYTFPMIRNEATHLIENLLISLNTEGDYNVYVVSYDLTIEQKRKVFNDEYVSLIDNITFTRIEDFNINSFLLSSTVYIDPSGYCYELREEISRSTGWLVTVRVDVPCNGNGNGSGNTGNGDTGNGDTGDGDPDPSGGGFGDGFGNDDNPTGGGGGGGSGGGDGGMTVLNLTPGQILANHLGITDTNQINFLSNNENISNKLIGFLDRENYSLEAEHAAREAISDLASYTPANYPGINDGLPFEWWLDNDFIRDSGHFDMPTANGLAREKPNAAEIALFALFSSAAPIHAFNSVIALQRAQQLVVQLDGNMSGIEDGRADAFRHAYWNALGSASFGSFIMKKFADAHELGKSGDPVVMDFHNNNEGRIIGDTFNSVNLAFIETAVLLGLDVGDLRYIKNGIIVPTDQ